MLAAGKDDLAVEQGSQRHTYQQDNNAVIGDENTAARVLHFYEELADYDDTQNVYSNFDNQEEVLA